MLDGHLTFGQAALGVDELGPLTRLFADHLARFDIEHFGYAMVGADGFPDRSRSVSTWPQEFLDYYYGAGLDRTDPSFALGRTLPRPFLWSRTFDPGRCGPRLAEALAAAGRFGLRDGITVGIPGGRGCIAVVDYTADGKADRLGRLLDRHREQLYVAALEFHHFVSPILDRRNRPETGPCLTERERECCEWLARGKSSWEIGQILAISERTVLFHINNVKRKLAVASRSEALVKLVMTGEIHP